ncbi:MAG: response regulator [Fibrobacterota bacterium]
MGINKILIVDDSPTMLRILVNTLEKAGYPKIIQAENGLIALDLLAKDADISLILSDWNMPEMTGIEFLTKVKSNEKTKSIPFIMVTSRNVKEDILQAIKLGARDYIVKPFTVDAIKAKLLGLG